MRKASGVEFLPGELFIDQNDRMPRPRPVIAHGGMHAVAVEEQGGTGFTTEDAVPGHVFESANCRVGAGRMQMASWNIGECSVIGSHVVEINLDFEVERIRSGYIEVPAYVAQGAWGDDAELGKEEKTLAAGQLLNQGVVGWVIDQVDEEWILRQGIGKIKKSRGSRTLGNVAKPVFFGAVGVANKGLLDGF